MFYLIYSEKSTIQIVKKVSKNKFNYRDYNTN